MGDHTAFFYGTLMAPPVLHRVIYGSSKPEPWQRDLTIVRPGLLSSYRRHRVAYADYPAILPHEDSTVRGSIVTGLTDGDIFRLDIFEGSQYERKKVKVRVLKGVGLDEAADEVAVKHSGTEDSQVEGPHAQRDDVEEVEAETYVWKDSADELEPEEWDFEEFKRDKMKAWMGERRADSDEEGDSGSSDTVVNVEIDQGFADVDKAVAEQQKQQQRHEESEVKKRDPTGGRGANGKITQQLKEVSG